MNEKDLNLRVLVRGMYDTQKLRIQMGNRIVANFKAKLGQKPSTKEDDMDAEAKALLADLRARFKKITDGVKTFPTQKGFTGDEVISSYTELCLLAQYVSLETGEAQHFRRLGNILEEYPIWTEFLKGVRGIGPAMAGVIISEFDIHKARYVSSLWKYAGLDTGPDGMGRSRRQEHLVEVEYTDKQGEVKTRNSITFNPFLKTKLMGVLATSFLRSASPYAKVYADRKTRLESHAKYGEHNDKVKDENGKAITSKLRRHNMAMREMVKRFLADLYAEWRKLEGLPVAAPYHEAKLGHVHRQAS